MTSAPGLLESTIAPYVELLYPGRHTAVCTELLALADRYAALLAERSVASPTERTACLITYGDGLRRRGEAPLHTLAAFLHDHVGDLLSDVHLLPFFPWTSDDGFAVVDHREVNPALGTWQDVADLAREHAR